MKRYSTKSWAVAVVLAITAADCVGIYVAQLRLHREVPVSANETAYADASAIKDTWHRSSLSPDAQRTFADASPYVPAAAPPVAPAPAKPVAAPVPQRFAQASAQVAGKVPAFEPRSDAFLAAPRLAEAAPAERVELATEVHAVAHRAALHRAAVRVAQKNATPPTSLSFAAAFGGSSASTAALALPEPAFGKQADGGTVSPEPGNVATTQTDAPRADLTDALTIGKPAQASVQTNDPELPAVAAPVQSVVQSASLPTN